MRRLLLVVLISWVGLTAAAGAEPKYTAAYVEQCCYVTVESGEIRSGLYFTLRNTSATTWSNTNEPTYRFKLAPWAEPGGRVSLFQSPAWPEPNRPAILQQDVPPNAETTFTFSIRAPSVAVQTVYRETFRLVRENDEWIGPSLWHDYTVLPSLAPTVSLAGLPPSVVQGDPLTVTANATDNGEVAGVEARIDAGAATALSKGAGTTFSGALPTAGIAPGTHRVTVTAKDRAGNTATADTTFQVDPPPAAAAPAPIAVPPLVPPLQRQAAFSPIFATTAARRKRGPLLGRLLTIELTAAEGARVEILCARGCSRSLSRRIGTGRKATRAFALRPAWTLKRGAVIEIRSQRPGYAIRFERYAFTRLSAGLRPRQVGAGCLSSIKPRQLTKCP